MSDFILTLYIVVGSFVSTHLWYEVLVQIKKPTWRQTLLLIMFAPMVLWILLMVRVGDGIWWVLSGGEKID